MLDRFKGQLRCPLRGFALEPVSARRLRTAAGVKSDQIMDGGGRKAFKVGGTRVPVIPVKVVPFEAGDDNLGSPRARARAGQYLDEAGNG